jgi:hypothetical protein
VNQLIDIISSDELNVRSEEQVFNAVLAWVKYNVAERRGHLPQVFNNPRYVITFSQKFNRFVDCLGFTARPVASS